jgi:hypothetical protein
MTISEKRLATISANYIKITNRMIKKRGGPLETYIKEREIVFFKFPKTMKTSLEPKTIPAKAIEVSTTKTINIPFLLLLNIKLIYIVRQALYSI